jgi:hypothetical protein
VLKTMRTDIIYRRNPDRFLTSPDVKTVYGQLFRMNSILKRGAGWKPNYFYLYYIVFFAYTLLGGRTYRLSLHFFIFLFGLLMNQ